MTTNRRVRIEPTFDTSAWKYMRLSAILLIPMVWFHTIFTTLIVGAENTNLGLVAARWATTGWRVYDALLLAFAFSHGVTGLRQVLFDFTTSAKARKALNILLLLFWIALSAVGMIGIVGGVAK